MKCISKLTLQSVTHVQSFKEICDIVQNGYEDLKETASQEDIRAKIKQKRILFDKTQKFKFSRFLHTSSLM